MPGRSMLPAVGLALAGVLGVGSCTGTMIGHFTTTGMMAPGPYEMASRTPPADVSAKTYVADTIDVDDAVYTRADYRVPADWPAD